MLEFKEAEGKEAAKAVKVVLLPENGADLERIGKIASAAEIKMLKAAVKNRDFKFENGKKLVIDDGLQKFILFGVKNKPTAQEARLAGAAAAGMVKKDKEAALFLPAGWEKNAADAALGMELELYSFDKYFTRKKDDEFNQTEKVYLIPEKGGIDAKAMENMRALANGVRYARDLSNEPGNMLTPEVMAADVKRLEYLGIEVEVVPVEKLEEKGFKLLYAVGKGSENKPCAMIMKWRGNPARKDWDIALVGKGITFDAGGINLKTASGLIDMKRDMTGAAVTAASLKILALEKRRINAAAVLVLAENMPDGGSYKPDDVIATASGQTVEIVNTDAEGRLALADGLWYASTKLKAKKVIDIATLTGAIMIALGSEFAGLFSNDDKMAEALLKAGQDSGEKLWRMPLCEEFGKMLKSDIADIKHHSSGRGAGSAVAAMFLQSFVGGNAKWAHLDIAGCDTRSTPKPTEPKGGTGFGVRVLYEYIKGLSPEKK